MENIGGIFLVFLNVVTPVFILVVIGYFVGPRLKIEARSLSRTAYFVFIPAFVFNIISEAKIDSGLALQMLSFILVAQIAVACWVLWLVKPCASPGKLQPLSW